MVSTFEAFSHHPDGTFFKSASSNGNTAMIEVPGCGSVTAADGFTQYITVTGVEPGDNLNVTTSEPAMMSLPISISVPVAGAKYYVAQAGPCVGSVLAGPSPTIMFRYWSGCIDATGKTTILVSAIDDVKTLPQHVVFADVMLSQQPALNVTSWTTAQPHRLSLTINPQHPARIGWFLSPRLKKLRYQLWYTETQMTGSNFEIDQSFGELGDATSHKITLSYPDGRTRIIEQILGASPPAVILENLEPKLLPFVDTPTRDSDPVRPTISFSTSANVVEEDMVRVGILTQHPQASRAGFWWVVAPPGTRTVRLPEIPSSHTVTFPNNSMWAQLTDSTDIPDYETARQSMTTFDLRLGNSVVDTVGGMSRSSDSTSNF